MIKNTIILFHDYQRASMSEKASELHPEAPPTCPPQRNPKIRVNAAKLMSLAKLLHHRLELPHSAVSLLALIAYLVLIPLHAVAYPLPPHTFGPIIILPLGFFSLAADKAQVACFTFSVLGRQKPRSSVSKSL